MDEIVLVLIIYTAVLLLIIFYIYPQLKKLFKHKISISIQIGTKEKEVGAQAAPPGKQEKFPSVLGKTKFVLSQPLPNAASDLETENRKEKEDTFAPETKKSEDEKPDSTVNLETGEGLDVEEDSKEAVNADEELEGLGVGNEPEDRAGGIDYDNLGRAAKTISDPKDSSPTDEDMAGKVLSENKYTQLVQSMRDARPEYAQRITELMDRHERKLAETQNMEVKASRKKQKLYESEEFKNFNPNDIS
jgi:hypothetical protein